MFRLEKIIRPNIQKLIPYSSARDDYKGNEGIFLDANENALGSVIDGNFNRYPDPYQQDVKQKAAGFYQIKPEQMFMGNGSDEAIDLLFRCFCEPSKDNVILLPPTYGMYEVLANINDVEIRKVNLLENFQPDIPPIQKAIDKCSKLIFVCSPNNPTGNLIKKKAIEALLKSFHGLVVVDEAYVEFAPEGSVLQLIDIYPNLVLLRTFSKAWGMAALRLGMAFANEKTIQVLNKVKHPYNVNHFTQESALKALAQTEKLRNSIELLTNEREKLVQSLKKLSFVEKVFPSDANFVLVKMQDALSIFNLLKNQKIIVRDRSKVILCAGCLRITVGIPAENEELMKALDQLKIQ